MQLVFDRYARVLTMKQTGMHRCLYIPEILENIFSFFQGWWKRRTLAKLARTCREFNEPAIKLLWRHLPGFEPIMKFFPPDFLDDEKGVYAVNIYYWPCQQCKDALRRIGRYTHYVRRLDWAWHCALPWPTRVNGFHHSVFRKLYEDEDCPRPLFPNLQEVQLPYSTSDPLAAVFYPSLVLSPSVRVVEIISNGVLIDLDRKYEDTADAQWRAFAGHLCTIAPNLTRCKATGYGFKWGSLLGKNLALEQIAPQFSFAMSDLDLSALILDGSGLTSMGSGHLTGLSKLSISVAHQQTAELVSHSPVSLSFPALENLSINILSFNACCAVANLLDAKRLKTSELNAYMHSGEDGERTGDDYDPQPLFQSLLNAGAHISLERLILKKVWINPDVAALWTARIDEQRLSITEETLCPLQPFTKLKCLTVDPCDSSGLTNEAFIRAFASWPCIEECILSDESFGNTPPALTISGVHQALQQAPFLKTLTIRFNGEIVPWGGDLHPMPPHPSLQMLDVASSTLSITSSGKGFGLWLQRHYPKVSKAKGFTRFREAMDRVYEVGDPDQEDFDDRPRFAPFIDLTTMVDRWNNVAYILRGSVLDVFVTVVPGSDSGESFLSFHHHVTVAPSRVTTTPEMHRCLAIPEVLDNIFSNQLCTSKALWRLARTCKVFHEPAIRNLWRHLANFDPILSLLPRDIMALDSNALVTGIIHIDWCVHKARIKSALERIQHYARYIRRLDWGWAYKYSSPPKYAVHHSVFRKLYEHEDCPRPLFPNLKEVVIPYPKNDPLVAVFYPSLVLSPSVRTIEVVAEGSTSISLDANHTDSTDGRWTSLASRLFKMAPHLEVFEVAAGGAFRGTLSFYGKLDAFERQVLPNFSSRMTRLKLASLVLDGSTFSALGGGHLVGLVELSISLAEQQCSQLLCESSTALSFPSLERLSISVLSLKTCQVFLELLDATKLKELKLKVYMDSDDEGNEQGDDYNPQPLFKALIGRGNTCLEDISLKKIWINEDAEHLWYACINERVFTVAPETVQPLLAFSNLSSLSIEPCDTSTLDDDTLSTMLSSWPSLQTLELADHTFAFEPPVLTLIGVHKALQCVPSLEILSIRFDGSIIPPHDPRHSFPPHPSLNNLDVTSSTISLTSSQDFTPWLLQYYPKVEDVWSFSRFRRAMDSVFGFEGLDDEALDRERFAPFIDLATMVDRWNDVMHAYGKVARN